MYRQTISTEVAPSYVKLRQGMTLVVDLTCITVDNVLGIVKSTTTLDSPANQIFKSLYTHYPVDDVVFDQTRHTPCLSHILSPPRHTDCLPAIPLFGFSSGFE